MDLVIASSSLAIKVIVVIATKPEGIKIILPTENRSLVTHMTLGHCESITCHSGDFGYYNHNPNHIGDLIVTQESITTILVISPLFIATEMIWDFLVHP